MSVNVFKNGELIPITNNGKEVPDKIVLHKDSLGEPTEPAPRDCDTLGGKSPEYYAKSSEVSELNQNLTDLQQTLPIYAKITGTTVALGSWVVFSFPDGFDANNCYIASYDILNASNERFILRNDILMHVTSSGVRVGATSSAFANRPITIIVVRYPNI